MRTIFTIPKPFVGLNRIIQINAIQSWLRLAPSPEIILFGDDDGVGDAAQELGVHHVPSVQKNEYGTPLLGSVFQDIEQIAKNKTIMYANADMIFTPDLTRAIEMVDFPQYLLCGRRWDIDIRDFIDFDSEWVPRLRMLIQTRGQLHGFSGIDYFIFRKGTVTMREFAVGRPGWDGWLIYNMRSRKIPVINATAAITAIHQNHDYSHSRYGKRRRVEGPELARNIEIGGGWGNLLTLREADWLLTRVGVRRPVFPYRLLSMLAIYFPYRFFLSVKRYLQRQIK